MSRAHNQGYRIVCGVDFASASGEAVREAHRLSRRVASSELHFVHALDAPQARSESIASQRASESAISRLQDYVRSVLFDVNVSLNDLRAVFHVRQEDPQSALSRVAHEEQADVIIVGASTGGRLSQLWRRWGVRSFMQRAPVPVLVAHERKQEVETVSEVLRHDGSGVYSVVGGRCISTAASARSMESDSASSLHRMYEARASQPPISCSPSAEASSQDRRAELGS